MSATTTTTTTATTTTTTNNNNKELLQPTVYPSPSLSPATSHLPNSRPRHSVKALLTSSNPPASPLDALVMALEATVDEDHNHIQQEAPDHLTDQDDDPDATIPSSPTMFMKRTPGESSLHHLPTMMLPESAASTLTPSTQPHGFSSARGTSQRKMSISSQDSSSSSVNSNSDRTKEYACTVGSCEKKFYQVAHLRSHERCHSGARPYVCRFDGCDRAFTQLGNLKTHERKHTGERPYKCPHPDCDKTFTQLGNLKTHERIHDEVKPFMCRLPGCGKTFSQLGNLKTHTLKMHPEVTISDEELAMRATTSPIHGSEDQGVLGATSARLPHGSRLVHGGGSGAVQVIAHFNPYQRRPIEPQQYEEEMLLRKIRTMVQHQKRVRELEYGSEVSDDMEEW